MGAPCGGHWPSWVPAHTWPHLHLLHAPPAIAPGPCRPVSWGSLLQSHCTPSHSSPRLKQKTGKMSRFCCQISLNVWFPPLCAPTSVAGPSLAPGCSVTMQAALEEASTDPPRGARPSGAQGREATEPLQVAAGSLAAWAPTGSVRTPATCFCVCPEQRWRSEPRAASEDAWAALAD